MKTQAGTKPSPWRGIPSDPFSTLQVVPSVVSVNRETFDSGAYVVDVRLVDDRLLTFAWSESTGFTVDEACDDRAFGPPGDFHTERFQEAYDHLFRLVISAMVDISSKTRKSTIQSLVISVNDLEQSRTFYEQFGFAFQEEQHGKGPRHLSTMSGDVLIELYPRSDAANRSRVGFRVPFLDRVVESTKRQKLGTVVRPIRETPWGRMATLDDPSGNRIDLTETASA